MRFSRPTSIGTAQVPVRRYGTVPPPPEEVPYLEAQDDEPPPRTIGERGGLAVCVGGLLAALVGGALLYA
jgi:hypothetical protein